jgi:hypothetical protein
MSEGFIPGAATSNGFVAAPQPLFATHDGRGESRDSARPKRGESSGSRDRAGGFPQYFNQKANAAVVVDMKSRNAIKVDNYMTHNPILEQTPDTNFKRLMSGSGMNNTQSMLRTSTSNNNLFATATDKSPYHEDITSSNRNLVLKQRLSRTKSAAQAIRRKTSIQKTRSEAHLKQDFKGFSFNEVAREYASVAPTYDFHIQGYKAARCTVKKDLAQNRRWLVGLKTEESDKSYLG